MMSSDNKSALYSSFAAHTRSELKPEVLERASAALRRAKEARTKILNIHRSTSDDEEESRREIEEVINAEPSDFLEKFNKLFNSPLNLLPPDMKYDVKAAEKAREYFQARTVELQTAPKSSCIESMERLSPNCKQLPTIKSKNILQEHQTKPLNVLNLDLKSDTEQTVEALKKFKDKFVSLDKELPEMPNELNEEVHEKIRALSKIVHTVNEFIEFKSTLVEGASDIDDSVKEIPAAGNNEMIENLLCQLEKLK